MNKSYLAKRSVIQKSTNKWMCFINTFIMHSRCHVICNYTEKVTLECLQVTSQTPFIKTGSYNSMSLQGKTTMSNNFELEGEDEM